MTNAGVGQPIAVVTGSRRGIGRALAEWLLGRGYLVYGLSRTQAGWSHPNYRHRLADVADEPAVKAVFSEIRKDPGPLEVVLNNAAVASMNHILLTPAGSVQEMLSTSVVGTFVVTREATKLMKKQQFGRIVNFGSAAVPLRLAGEAAYIASKSAVNAATQVLAHELAPFGITINVVSPSITDTDMTRGVPEEKLAAMLDQLPLRRPTVVPDIINVLDFFLDRGSDMVTGQILYLGGAPNV